MKLFNWKQLLTSGKELMVKSKDGVLVFVKEHQDACFIATIVIGVGGTAYCAAKAGLKYEEVLATFKEDTPTPVKVWETAKTWAPTGAFATGTILASVLYSKDMRKQLTASAAMLAIAEKSTAEWREKAKKVLDPKEFAETDDEVTSKEVKSILNSPASHLIPISGDATQLYKDHELGFWFKSDPLYFERVLLKAEKRLAHDGVVSANDIFWPLNIKDCYIGDKLGYETCNQSEELHIEQEGKVSSDGYSYIEVDFHWQPISSACNYL